MNFEFLRSKNSVELLYTAILGGNELLACRRMHLQMMDKLKSCWILICPGDKYSVNDGNETRFKPALFLCYVSLTICLQGLQLFFFNLFIV